MDTSKYDKRIVERNLKSRILSPKEYQDHIKSLEDAAPKAERLNVPLYSWESDASARPNSEKRSAEGEGPDGSGNAGGR